MLEYNKMTLLFEHAVSALISSTYSSTRVGSLVAVCNKQNSCNNDNNNNNNTHFKEICRNRIPQQVVRASMDERRNN